VPVVATTRTTRTIGTGGINNHDCRRGFNHMGDGALRSRGKGIYDAVGHFPRWISSQMGWRNDIYFINCLLLLLLLGWTKLCMYLPLYSPVSRRVSAIQHAIEPGRVRLDHSLCGLYHVSDRWTLVYRGISLKVGQRVRLGGWGPGFVFG
jgi:hypothetical protein